MSIGTSKLSGTQGAQKDQLSNSVKLLLLWIAASDGDLDPSELEFADDYLPEADEAVSTENLLGAIRSSDLYRLEQAIRVVANESRELRAAFLDMAIAMSMADREIAFSENHLLRFYADALLLGEDMLSNRFRSVTGNDLPEPGDPSQPDWWPDDHHETAKPSAAADTLESAQARALLALSPLADRGELERKYHELKKIFQSNRVDSMGPAAVKVAAHRLERIEHAYQVMSKELGQETAQETAREASGSET